MFHLFAGYEYYPSGGMADYLGVYPSLADAQTAALAEGEFKWHWAHVAMVGHDGRLKTVATRKIENWEPQEWEVPS
jgi:hypothetical protein